MKNLQEAFRWYEETVRQLRLWQRLVKKYWANLPWQDILEKDEKFRNLDETDLIESSNLSLRELDDLAVLVLFSFFESMVRGIVSSQVQLHVKEKAIEHIVLVKAAQDAIERVENGSFYSIIEPYKALDPDLVEQANQVSHYRNWVAHGRRGKLPAAVDPRAAYDRLTKLWEAIFSGRPVSD
jgi:hypothetical protein